MGEYADMETDRLVHDWVDEDCPSTEVRPAAPKKGRKTMTDTPDQHWVSLDIKNVMGIKAVRMERKGAVTTVGGKNGAGKSTTIRSLWMALGGASQAVDEPLREGAKKGEVILELTDYFCKVTLSAKGKPKFAVKAKDGSTLPPPATFLKTLTKGHAFNPAAFYAQKPDRQLETLREIVSLDTREIDFEHDKLYEERTDLGREVKRLDALHKATPFHRDAPEQEVSVAELVTAIDAAKARNAEKNLQRRALGDMRATNVELKAEIAETEKKLEELKTMFAESVESGKAQAAKVKELGDDEDWQPAQDRIATAESDNRKLRENAEHHRYVKDWETKVEEHSKLTAKLATLDLQKDELVAAAKFPVPGLGFGDGCVLYNGRSLDQACGMERMKVSLGIGMAQNPGLKLLTVDDEEKLDEDEHAALLELAESEGFDLIVARVSRGEECDVIIEDGQVKERA